MLATLTFGTDKQLLKIISKPMITAPTRFRLTLRNWYPQTCEEELRRQGLQKQANKRHLRSDNVLPGKVPVNSVFPLIPEMLLRGHRTSTNLIRDQRSRHGFDLAREPPAPRQLVMENTTVADCYSTTQCPQSCAYWTPEKHMLD